MAIPRPQEKILKNQVYLKMVPKLSQIRIKEAHGSKLTPMEMRYVSPPRLLAVFHQPMPPPTTLCFILAPNLMC